MSRSKSSHRWLREHESDHYVKKSREDGYRSRASYKLIELNRKDRIFRPGMTVVDLGAAPGGWSQVAAELVDAASEKGGRVIATDILPMDSIAGVEFVQGDFTEQDVLNHLIAAIGRSPVDLVISDMAPNMSGLRDVDQPRSMYLVELALDMARQVLKPGGTFVAKVFQGEGFEPWLRDTRSCFASVANRKPDASRSRSREVYMVAKGFKG